MCNFTNSAVINDDIACELTSYTDSSSRSKFFPSVYFPPDSVTDFCTGVGEMLGHIQQSTQTLAALSQSFALAQREQHYQLLRLLVSILIARREQDKASFLERFDSKYDMERTLRICMAQSLTARSVVTRDTTWLWYLDEWLDAAIPDYESAYDFYQAYDLGYSTVPAGYYLEKSDGSFRWVAVVVSPFNLFNSF